MQHRVYFAPDPYFESVAMLINAQNGTTIRKNLDNLFDGGAIHTPDGALEALYEACAALEESLDAAGVRLGDDAPYLYRRREAIEPLAQALWYQQHWAGDAPRDRRMAIVDVMLCGDGDDAFAETDASFLRWLDGPDFTPEDRYDLLKLYHCFDRYAASVREDVAAIAPRIEAHLPGVQPFIDAAMGYVQDRLERDGIGFFRDVVNFGLDDAHAYDIYPTLAQPNALYGYGRDDDQRVAVFLGIGLFDTVRFLKTQRRDDKRLLAFAKLLADPTKWNILMALRHESLYSTQLAERMHLTGATISHHMSAFTSLGVVTVRKEGNRVYYEIDRSAMESFLSEMARQLLPG